MKLSSNFSTYEWKLTFFFKAGICKGQNPHFPLFHNSINSPWAALMGKQLVQIFPPLLWNVSLPPSLNTCKPPIPTNSQGADTSCRDRKFRLRKLDMFLWPKRSLEKQKKVIMPQC